MAQVCGYALATPVEMNQFHNELQRQGWVGAFVATVPTRYAIRDGEVMPIEPRFATFLGDVDGDRQPERVVGCYFPPASTATEGETTAIAPGAAPGGPAARGPQDDRARLVVFKRDAEGQWRFAWRSPGLGYSFHPPEYNLREVREGLDELGNLRLPIALIDVDGDGRREIAYYCVSQSPHLRALPGVYHYDGTRWLSVAPQADRFALRDLNRDGTMEVIAGTRYVGYGAGDDDVPRIWRWSGSRYQEASREFPSFYSELAARYQAYVKRMRGSGDEFNRAAWERAIQKAASMAG